MSALAFTVFANVVQVCKMTTVSFVAFLTAMSNRLATCLQICCWDSNPRPFSFLPVLLKFWLVLFCTTPPSSYPTIKSQTGLNQAICMGTQ